MPPAAVVLVSWLVPGAGHLVQGRRQKGVIFLAAIANLGMGIPYFIAKLLGLGPGVVTAASYEYGNTFLIVSGLLNMLVAIDAYDVRLGRK